MNSYKVARLGSCNMLTEDHSKLSMVAVGFKENLRLYLKILNLNSPFQIIGQRKYLLNNILNILKIMQV